MSENDSASGLLSVIVPVWRDDGLIPELLAAAEDANGAIEWIVAAVEPSPELRRLAEAGILRLVVCDRPSRGAQMNAGASVSSGTLLCFNHADTILTARHIAALRGVAARQEIVGGAFLRRFDDRRPWMQRWERVIHRLDQKWGPFFGDQSLFVRAEVFHRLGGFADIPLMEDLEFSRRLKRAGRVTLLHPPVWSSPRRFRRIGNCTTTAINALCIVLFYAGVPPQLLHRWYYAAPRFFRE